MLVLLFSQHKVNSCLAKQTKAHHQMSKQVKSSWKDAEDLVQLMSKDATPVLDASLLLQELDVHRLRNIIYYRDIVGSLSD